jgi:hypothetical protein
MSYFLKLEHDYIHNYLFCQFGPHDNRLTADHHIKKMRASMPSHFPANRFDHLAKKHLPNSTSTSERPCNQTEQTDYENTVLYSLRPYLYPLFPNLSETFNLISKSLYHERITLHGIAIFKQVLNSERESFDRFVQDCSRIQEISDQIKLLEKHLKIDKYAREPSRVLAGKNAELRMNRSIRKQLNFAKKHLSTNEKLFIHKWKIYLEFESEQPLCPR